MISSASEYELVRKELESLEKRLADLRDSSPPGSKGLTKAGIRKLIARLHEELAVYEGTEKARQTNPV